MPTINGVSFNIIGLPGIITEHFQKRTPIPGTAGASVDDMGYNGLQISIRGYETTLQKYDEVIAEFMASGEIDLVVRDDWKYKVYSSGYSKTAEQEGLNYFPYEFVLVTREPFQYSEDLITRTKSITSNNQTWSADNSGNEITTNGTVYASPDIKIVAGAASSVFGRDGVGVDATDATEYTDDGEPVDVYELYKTVTRAATMNRKHHVSYASLDMRTDAGGHAYCKITYQAASLNGGAETDLVVFDTVSNTYVGKSDDTIDITAAENETLVLKWYLKNTVYSEQSQFKNARYTAIEKRPNVVKNAQIHNNADTTVKADICNNLNPDAIIRINADGNGTFSYATAFADMKFWTAAFGWSGATLDDPNNELDIADDGHLYVDVDCKYPVTGIPILTAQINITAGTPTIQISSDAVTWYDIDTAIVDDVSTEYALDCASLSLKGLTTFYFRFDCGGTGTVTCSIKTFQIDCYLVGEYMQKVAVLTGGANTFKCTQHADSSLACEISLIYNDRKWSN